MAYLLGIQCGLGILMIAFAFTDKGRAHFEWHLLSGATTLLLGLMMLQQDLHSLRARSYSEAPITSPVTVRVPTKTESKELGMLAPESYAGTTIQLSKVPVGTKMWAWAEICITPDKRMYLEIDGDGLRQQSAGDPANVERRADGWYFLGDNIGKTVKQKCDDDAVPLKDGTR